MHYEGAGSGYRTLRVRRKHITAFHTAAYKWYTLHHEMSPGNPLRLLVAGVLVARAGMQVGIEYALSIMPRQKTVVETRPEGGTAL
jgi:hypothetical protein